MSRRIFAISGMHCAGCAAHLERAVGAIVPDGQVRVNFPAAQLFVEGGPADREILDAIRKAGFAGKITSGALPGDGKETFFTLRRFAVAAFFALALMVTAHVPIANETVRGVLQALFAAGAMVSGWRFYPRGLLQLLRGAPDMDSLISLGTGGAFLYSVCALFTGGARFFDSVGMIVALILLGKGLEISTRKKITGAITALLRELPEKAQKITPGGEVAVDPAEIRIGDRLKVRPGERIPADGVVVEGNCEVDESLLTGENLPVAKTPGGKVIGGSVNLAGSVVIEAACVGDATVVAQMVRMVSEAQSRRPAISRIADRASGYFTWFVLGSASCTALGWLISGAGAATALHYALAVLVVSCPCALGLATPLAVSAAISAAARRGILVRDGAALEKLGKIGKCVFDKTGTLTDGRFTIEKIVCRENFSENDLLRAAAAAERDIRHPLAETLRAESAKRRLEIPPFEMVSSGGSRGVACRIGGRFWKIGAPDFAGVEIPGTTPETVVAFVRDGIFAGFIAFRDQLRHGAPELFDFLRRRGIATAILSGDRVSSVAAVGKMLGADEVFGALLPENKTGIIRAGRENAPGNLPVMMVGDGINDAPALALADVGVALGAGAAVALESADIVLPGNDLSGVQKAILLGEKTMKIIRENLFWAFFYNLLMIPLAAGVFAALFGGPHLSVVAAAAAMSCSSLGVVFNSRRLLRF